MGPPNGANITSPPGSPPWITTASEGGGGAVPCAFANPALNTKIPLRTALMDILRFIIPSPLLSQTVANFLKRRFRQFRLSTAAIESSKDSIRLFHHRGPQPSLFSRTPSRLSFLTSPE